MSFDPSKFLFEALTYDDVLLVPAYSEVLPREADTSSYLTPKIKLNIPIISAAICEKGKAVAKRDDPRSRYPEN